MTPGDGNHPLIPHRLPQHVAIIMDGSGRWATARGLPRVEGHRAGRMAVRRTVAAAFDLGIRVLTLFTFSTENWGRPEVEVAALMQTFETFFRVDSPGIAARGARITVTGRRDRLPAQLRHAIEDSEATSHRGTQMHLRFAIDYSGRESILNAACCFQQRNGDAVGTFARLLAAGEPGVAQSPDVDLLIRTGGEQRLSNCPLWEIAYAELYFTPCLWPDFGAADLDAAVQEFASRHRRFGRIPVPVEETAVE